jgi:hypothetical protein
MDNYHAKLYGIYMRTIKNDCIYIDQDFEKLKENFAKIGEFGKDFVIQKKDILFLKAFSFYVKEEENLEFIDEDEKESQYRYGSSGNLIETTIDPISEEEVSLADENDVCTLAFRNEKFIENLFPLDLPNLNANEEYESYYTKKVKLDCFNRVFNKFESSYEQLIEILESKNKQHEIND